mgnify:CR=1 FL=1
MGIWDEATLAGTGRELEAWLDGHVSEDSQGLWLVGAPATGICTLLHDLVVDQGDFLDKLETVRPWLVPARPRRLEDGPHRQTPQQLAAYQGTAQCINCLLCHAACPQVGLKPGFLGPAALALAHRYNADSRDAGWTARRDVLNAEDGVWGCTLVGHCSAVCPKAVDPAHAINQNKIGSTLDYVGLGRLLHKKGQE